MTQFVKDRPYIILNGQTYKIESYSYDDAQYFVPPLRQGLPKYEDFAPETVIGWRSWHHGYGDLYYDDTQTYYEAVGVDASIVGQITLAPLMASTAQVTGSAVGQGVTQFQEFKNELYAVGQNTLLYWVPSASPNGWTIAASLGGHLGKSAQFTVLAPTASFAPGQYLYVPTATQYWVFSNASTFTAIGTAAAHFEVVGNRLWRGAFGASGQWTISNSADGATWQTNGIFQLGNGVATLNWLMSYDSVLYMMSTQGLSSIDSLGNTIDLAPEIGRYADASFGVRSDTFHGIAYIPSSQGLLQFNGSQVINPQTSQAMKSIGPDVNSWSQSEVRGRIQGLAPYVNYLYGTMQSTSGNGYVVKFRDFPDINPGQGWHPIAKFAGATMGAIKVSNLSWGAGNAYPILWVSAGNTIYETRLPQDNDNSLTSMSVLYNNTGTITFPIVNDHIPTFKKTFIRMVLDISCPSQTSVEVDASLDNGPYNSVAVISGTTGVLSYSFQPTASYNFAYQIQPRLTLSSTASNQTPVVRSAALHHVINQPVKGQWNMVLSLEEKAIPNQNKTSSNLYADLVTARNVLSLIPFSDWDDQIHFVSFIHMNPTWVAREPGRGPQFTANVILQDFGLTGALVGSAYVGFAYVA